MIEMARHITERDWQQQVNDLLRYYGYYVYHPFRSDKSSPGWPDVVALSPEQPSKLLALELKVGKNKTTAAQEKWLERWRKVPGATVAVVRPEDFEWLVRVVSER